METPRRRMPTRSHGLATESTQLVRARRPNHKSRHHVKVLLVSMPWADPTLPSLGLSLLKSALTQAAISCDVLYGNLRTLPLLPLDDVRALGEHPVASLLYGALLDLCQDNTRDCIQDEILAYASSKQLEGKLQSNFWQTKTSLRELLLSCRQELDTLADDITAASYDVIGFTVAFEQTTASLALAHRLKERCAGVVIVFGGASCDGPMGAGLLDGYSYVDYAISGEADTSVVLFVKALTGDGTFASVPGLSYRSPNGVRHNGNAKVTDLNSLPFPDFDDYFEQIASLVSSTHSAHRDLARAVLAMPTLPIESSRGCWWGEKHLCSFCGLNGTTLGYRDKDHRRMLAEIMTLSKRHSVQQFHVVDNILSMKFFEKGHVLPELARRRATGNAAFSLFFEIKSNLKREQIKMLADAGVDSVQPGIESFSDHILALMDKGATGIQQMQLLKWCAEFGIAAVWNIITHNPGETVHDYNEMLDLVSYIRHLPPPAALPRMQLQRFSPYFEDPGRYGISEVRPATILRHTYRLNQTQLERIAYFFEFDHAGLEDDELNEARRRLVNELQHWKKEYRPNTLTYSPGPGFVRIRDARAGTGVARVVVLSGLSARVFSFCEVNHSIAAIRREFSAASTTAVDGAVDEMVTHKLMWRDGKGRCLSLPVRR